MQELEKIRSRTYERHEILNCVGTGSDSEARLKGRLAARGFGVEIMGCNNDLCLHLLYFDYPIPAASMYLNHDDFGQPAMNDSRVNAPLSGLCEGLKRSKYVIESLGI